MHKVKAEIITIGDEILIGQIVDTNSAWMAQELNKIGIHVLQITAVADDASEITSSLDLALNRADIVLITGGVGPTKDDITKLTLTRYFNTKLVFDDAVYANILVVLKNRSRAINELTKAQANVPESCTVIQNTAGTAPITWFDRDARVIVSMPGVPLEMKHAMSSEILPRLKQRFDTPTILHRTVMVHGYPESALALKIADWENALPAEMRLAYLPNMGLIRLRLSASSDDSLLLESALTKQLDALSEILGDAIFSMVDVPLEQIIGKLLLENGKSIATAESCTGGSIASRISSVAGSSAYYKGSVVAYANEIKIRALNVAAELIDEFGAVSAQVVEAMAVGARHLMQSDFAIATSGIAGPSGGTADKPVGTVWIAVAYNHRVESKLYHFGTDRGQNIERTTQAALLMLKELL